ncbi:MAG: low specificity L-threonine aldolase [Lachnospiraceae bacterium]|nr:low specificity L-threonine aldolase [Lachnospiraceae bacterium]
MIRFECDYLEGAHPLIMRRLMETNLEQTPGYSTDEHCAHARRLIRAACNAPDADVHLLVGGTQTNAIVTASILRPYQGVLCAETGHINVHEAGAIEACGHKVLPLATTDGRLSAESIQAYYDRHFQDSDHEHIVQPAMVYISQPTENGTLYSKAELTAISTLCRRLGMPLYLDGARMGYGLASPKNDLTLSDIASLCDVFYIGGTKVGALFGEALVITNPALKKDFRYLIKQRGGLLAKGRLLGIQFETLFADDLYMMISRHAITLAMQIRKELLAKGIPLYYDSYTNQQFPILTKEQTAILKNDYTFNFWADLPDDRSVIRLCTSWATMPQHVAQLCETIRKKL